ncbi:MAG: hypothetical protein HYY93_10125 [Planctomycetes bacterium]|nr:hypothetical protein [Planctomycetota bacterium]
MESWTGGVNHMDPEVKADARYCEALWRGMLIILALAAACAPLVIAQ